jgi:hypothetical protein
VDVASDRAALDHPPLRRETTVAVVLGASEWPFYPDFDAAPSCRRSAHAIADYLRAKNGLNLPSRNVKVLVDPFELAPDIIRDLRSFIRERRKSLADLGTPMKDLIFY